MCGPQNVFHKNSLYTWSITDDNEKVLIREVRLPYQKDILKLPWT